MRWASATTAIGLALVAGGCRVDLVLEVVLQDDGSGQLTFTIEADTELMSFVDIDDIDLTGITGTGWELEGPNIADSGSSVTLRKNVPSAGQLGDVISQLDQGRFYSNVDYSIAPGLGVTDYQLSLTIAPTVTARDFSDVELAELLDGERFGELIEVIEERAGGPLDETIFVSARVVMPDGSETAGTVDLAAAQPLLLSGSSQFVDADIDDRRAAAAAARDSFDDSIRRVALFSGGSAVLAFILLSIGWRRRHRRFHNTVQ